MNNVEAIKAWHEDHDKKPTEIAKKLGIPVAELKLQLVDSDVIGLAEWLEREIFADYSLDVGSVTPDTRCKNCGLVIFHVVPDGFDPIYHLNHGGMCGLCSQGDESRIKDWESWEEGMKQSGWRLGLIAGMWFHNDGRKFYESAPIDKMFKCDTIGEYFRENNIIP